MVQGRDASGKDGLAKHVFGRLNPQGVAVTSFKAPEARELAHDFLWRQQLALPARGLIGVFNRSHYEEVLVARVHPSCSRRKRSTRNARAIRPSGSSASRTSPPGSAI